jgi:hypothetical protein
MKHTAILLVFILLVSACSLPMPGPGEENQPLQTTGPGATPEQGGGGPQVTLAAVTPIAETTEPEATQHDVFAPSVQSGSETGETPAPQEGAGAAPGVESTEQRVFAPSVQTSGDESGQEGEQDGGQEGEETGSGMVDPRVELEVTLQTLAVGETITVTGRPVDIGAPVYVLTLRDEGVQEAEPVVEVDANNQQTPGSGKSQVLELVSIQASADQVVLVLRGIAPGATTLTITARGQIQEEGEGTFEGFGSGEILLTVEE